MPWSVAVTNPNSERIAVENLTRQGFETYLPRFLFGQDKRPAILFPGYLFVFLQERWRSIFGTRGISTLIMRGEEPQLMRDAVMQELKSREDENGFVVVPEEVSGRVRFRKGAHVRVTNGPFYGMNGIVSSTTREDRVRVLFSLMGRTTPVLMRATELSVI